MNRRLYLGFLALPIYLYNATDNFAIELELTSSTNYMLTTTALIADVTNAHLKEIPTDIFTRDEQTEECLRRRKCKD